MYKVGSVIHSASTRPTDVSMASEKVSIMEHDTGQHGLRGLTAIEMCPECSAFSLSEIVLCKGTNIAAHKGRWYQVVSVRLKRTVSKVLAFPVSKSLFQCLNKSSKVNVEYRKCEFFRWRDDLGRMTSELVDDMWSKKNNGLSDRERAGVRCVGVGCAMRQQPRSGNRSCSNGRLCKSCCERAQKEGSPPCTYSSHNAAPFSFTAGLVSKRYPLPNSVFPSYSLSSCDVILINFIAQSSCCDAELFFEYR